MLQLPIGAYQTSVSECPVCGAELASAKGLGPHVRANHSDIHTTTERIRHDFNADPADVLDALHNVGGLTIQEISQRFGYHRDQIAESFDLLGVDHDDREGLQQIWEDRPESAREWASENAALGADGRDENGMEGVTGQEHPGWRGGKSIYDAVKKQLGSESWGSVRERIRERADHECEACGKPANEIGHRDLDVHHIVPIMCGGTNQEWNLMALCPSCHRAVEVQTRRLVDPVLIEN